MLRRSTVLLLVLVLVSCGNEKQPATEYAPLVEDAMREPNKAWAPQEMKDLPDFGSDVCGDAATRAIKNANLSLVRTCRTEPIEVDGKVGALVLVKYGEGSDCPSGCIFKEYVAIVEGDKVTEFYRLPAIEFYMQRFGSSCANFNAQKDHPGYRRTALLLGDKYIWHLIFDKFIPQAFPLHNEYDEYAGTACVLNGTVNVWKEFGNFDFSKLRVTYPKIDTCENVSVTRAKVCRLDGPSDVCAKNNCLTNVAIARNDSAWCERIVSEESYRPTLRQDDCYSWLAIRNEDAKGCERIVDAGIKDHCIGEVARAKRDATICEEGSRDYERSVCERTVTAIVR